MRFIAGVFGKAGSGKSYLIDQMLPYLPVPVFILDTQGDFNEGVQFYSADELRTYLIEGRPNASGIYVLNTTNDTDFEGFFEILVSSQAPGTIVIDEADLFCTPYAIDSGLQRIIKYGRHWEQNILYAARRPAEVNRNLTAQSDVLISFKQTEARDVAALKKSYDMAERLFDLNREKHEFLVMGDATGLPFYPMLKK